MESWLPIAGYVNYEVSDLGNVRIMRKTTRYEVGASLRLSNAKGYRVVRLRGQSGWKLMQVHRLVAFAFLGEPPSDAHEVAHGDGNPSNNKSGNLRWATRKENVADKVMHGTQLRGGRMWNCRLGDDAVLDIRATKGDNARLAKKYGITPQYVTELRMGRRRAVLETVK